MAIQSKIILILIISLFSSCKDDCIQDDDNTIKVLSWNIWHGGHSKDFPERGCEGTIGILKESGADVITMIETYGASDMVADSLGYYHRLLSSNLSIYSKYPIIETYKFPDSISTFNFGGVMLNVKGKKIRVFNTWLHYLPDMRLAPTSLTESEILAWDDAGTRDDEIKKNLSVLKSFMSESDSIPIIMAGDFNCHSHLDWIESTKNMYNHGGAVVRWTVSKLMQDKGFKDSFRELNPDPAKNIGATWCYGDNNQKREDRIDYLYYLGSELKAVSSETHNGILGEPYSFRNKEFLYASDHGFVLTDFKFIE